MKKYSRMKMPMSVVILSLIFGISVLGLSAVKQVTAQEKEDLLKTKEVISEPAEVKFEVEGQVDDQTEAIDYYLPYPGILPDHPMYWLKMIRDKFQLAITTNVTDKAEKLLLYADKRLGAGWALIEGNKVQLGVTTLTKAEKYLEKADSILEKIEGEEKLKLRFSKAIKKHQEILLMVKEKVGDEYRVVIEEMIKITKDDHSATKNDENQEYQLVIDDGERIIKFVDTEAKTALELLKKGLKAKDLSVEIKEYSFGSLIESIGDKKNTKEKAWIYYVNGESATMGADKYALKPGDIIEWKYIKPIF